MIETKSSYIQDAPDHPEATWQEERSLTNILARLAFRGFSSVFKEQADAALAFMEVKASATDKLSQAGFSDKQQEGYMSYHTIVGSSVPYELAPKIDFPGVYGLRNFYLGVIGRYGVSVPNTIQGKEMQKLIKKGPIGDFYQDIIDKLP